MGNERARWTSRRRRRALVRGACALGVAGALAVAGSASALDPQRAIHQYVLRTWTVDAGLPQNSVKAIAQTPEGYLWFGTEEGLVRFDGVHFTVFNEGTTPEITLNDIVGLCTDAGGSLWIASRGGGLLRYRDGRFFVWRAADGLVSDLLSSVACGADGDVWAGSPSGATHLRADVLTSYTAKDLPAEAVRAVAIGQDGVVFLGTDGGVARVVDGKVASTINEKSGLTSNAVWGLAIARDGALLVGGRGVVTRIGRETVHYTKADGVPEHDVSTMVEDTDGNLWVGMREGGIVRRRPDGVWSAFTEAQGLGSNVVPKLFEDSEKNIWIGTEGGGLQHLSNPRVVTFGKLDGITGALVWSVFEDHAANLWVGTRGGGVHRRAPDGTVKTFTTKEGLPSNTVYGIHEDRDHNLWFATEVGGAARLTGDTFTVFSTKNGLSSNWVRTVFADSHDNVWFGTEGRGLDRYTGGRFLHYGEDVLGSTIVRLVTEDKDGNVWFGTEGGGATRFRDEKFTTFRKKDGLSDDGVISVSLDDAGATWFGTYHGLTRYKDGKLARATTKQGLFNDLVFTTLSGPDDTLYMSSNMGISRMSKREFDEYARGERATITTKHFGKSDGMRLAECNGGAPAGVRGKDGKLWFANAAGVVMLDPAAIYANLRPPPVLIESMQVNRAAVPLRGDIRLDPDSQDFEFQYTAMSYVEPERVRFKYRLEGHDRDWVDAGNRRTAYFTNLAPGKYRFRVIAANNDGVWNEVGADVRFYLAPHFYETVPFYAAVGLGVLLLGASTIGLRVRQLKAKSRELERHVAERTVELKAALVSLEAKDARISTDLEQARTFQQSILPALPRHDGLTFGVVYHPADQVGGDIYDVCETSPGNVRVFIGDTTGHGVQASLRTMVLRTEYDAVKSTAGSPAAVLAAVNRRLCARYAELELRCSALCFDVKRLPDGGALLVYSNAAQPPILRASSAGVDEVYAGGPFLAVGVEAEFRDNELRLASGDRLLAYTDGIYEQEDKRGAAFGFEPMGAALGDRGLDAQAVVKKLCVDVKEFAGHELDDDLTMICIDVA